ncbi:unnamed protein product [Notodromas monacha]|uniref:Ubiquitin-conjugating enzyme E2 J2 n=1 Tax=Notodromas monacha TaxID=399045 RepID=A0A7R9BS90_9CRUS|nr:unnamed protein product [Notodromas monacha]CAG0920422.1 unnamed protein product [Notodromas monacha]
MVGKSTATSRLRQDYLRIKADPVPYVTAEPLPHNILEWHYVIRGPEQSLYQGGYYHGKLVFPAEYPYKPPRIYMITPNGRFKTNVRLCLSISDFHPDLWNPAWSVSTILTGLLSFMLESSYTLGSVETSDKEKADLAHQSLEFNLADKVFLELFPDCVEEMRETLRKSDKTEAAGLSSPNSWQKPSEKSKTDSGFLGMLQNVLAVVGLAIGVVIIKYALRESSRV